MTTAPQADPSRRAVLTSAAVGTVAAAGLSSRSSAQVGDKATFVLVHPAWFGGWCWGKVAPLLRAERHGVFTPTLTGLGERFHLSNPEIGLATHVEDIVNVLELEDLKDVILVGNSSGGMVITGVADRVPERLAQIVYLDAFVPQDNQALVDMLPAQLRGGLEALVEAEGEGWLLPRFGPPPWETIVRQSWGVTSDDDVGWVLPRLKPTPFKHFSDPVRSANPAAADVARVFIRCQRYQPGTHPVFDAHAAMAQETPGWRYRALDAGHLPFVTQPAELAQALVELAA